GYFLAMACDSIVARPTTITGSIGVFSVLFDLSGFLGNKIGITSQEVKTGAVGNMVSMTRPLSEVEREIWQKQTDEVYEIFTGKAAEGRGMKKDSIKKIASGRVWTGEQALANGLVDKIGGLSEAVRIAAEMGGAGEDYALRYYPKPRTVIEKFLDKSDREVSISDPIEKLAGPADKLLLNQWRKIRGYGGVQARIPYEFSIR
ncbi:MAG: S49 family peptidase, partial [Bacteroidota bacterium]